MSRTVLIRLAAGPVAGLAFALLPLAASAGVVDTGRTQCCSSIAPESPPATYYGATMFRDSDARSAWRPYKPTINDPPAPIETLLERIDAQEAEGGAMSPDLAQSLGWLGSAYGQKNRHREAIASLRRGIHVARMNEGLHTPSQGLMLEQLIDSYVSQGNYIAADKQQKYQFKVRSWKRKADDPEFREATLRYAVWLRGAYLADLDKTRYPRLVGLNDLYQNAIEELEESQGKNSLELLPYLQGRAELSYLISVYPGEREASFRAGAKEQTNFDLSMDKMLQFFRMRDHNFRYGLEALERKEQIIKHNPDSTARDISTARIAVADWYQWHRRHAAAIRIYEEAWEIAKADGGADGWLLQELGEPLELPRDTIFNPGDVPLEAMNLAQIDVSFSVDRHGDAKDIEFLTPRTEITEPSITRAYHYLRNMRFSPSMQDGRVVESVSIQRSYQIRY